MFENFIIVIIFRADNNFNKTNGRFLFTILPFVHISVRICLNASDV